MGNAWAEVASRLDVEPDCDEEEYGEADDLDEETGLEDEPGPFQFVEGERVVEEHRGANTLRDDRNTVHGDEDGGDPVWANQGEASAAIDQTGNMKQR